MRHSQADFVLDAFFVQIAEQKKSQIKGIVTMIAFCHKFWPAEEYHQQWIGLIDKTEVQGVSRACQLLVLPAHPQSHLHSYRWVL